MKHAFRNLLIVLALAGAQTQAALAVDVPDHEFANKATWKLPTAGAVREQALAWLASRDLDELTRAQAEAVWASIGTEGSEANLLDLAAATIAAADPSARPLVLYCSQSKQSVVLPNVEFLANGKGAAWECNNLRLLYGRWLVQEALYDEAASQLADLQPQDVVDPASLLFYQAVAHHRTLAREPGLKAISQLLEQEAALPKRFTSLARLMQADLEGLKDESLDHIARRMDDIRRRLDLGRAGPKVRGVEDGVIASLDKLIEDMEKQQQQAAAAAAARGARGARGTTRPVQPAQDSTPMQGKGPGEVAKKPIGDSSGWGDLPPRERQEALQQIGKDFPAHYRDVIEQYFRKLATESGEKPEK